VKNRMREIRTSGSVGDGGGNVPIYPAFGFAQGCQMGREGVGPRQPGGFAEEGEAPGLVQRQEPVED